MRWKKLGWRFLRGTVYVAGAGFLATHVPFLAAHPDLMTALLAGAMSAIDKALGIGGLVKDAAAK